MSDAAATVVVERPGRLELPSELASALVDASFALTDIARSRVANTGTYSYRFAELSDVLAAVRPVLHEHDLAQLQLVETETGTSSTAVHVRTLIVHRSGETFTSPRLRLIVPSLDAQRVGSAITYARRYSLMATLGITGDDDDDDGADAGSRATTQLGPNTRPARQAQGAAPPAPTYRSPEEAQARELLNAATGEVRTAIQRAFREHFGVSLSNLPRDRHVEALSFVIEQLAVPDDPGEAPYS